MSQQGGSAMQHNLALTWGRPVLPTGRNQMAEQIARGHHERWDGTGYPHGLAGEAIPLPARMVALADFFDALTHKRPHRGPWPVGKVVAEIKEQAGHHFDPRLVEAFLRLPHPELV